MYPFHREHLRSLSSPYPSAAFVMPCCLGLDQQPSPLMWLVISDKWHQAGCWSSVPMSIPGTYFQGFA